MIYLTEPVDEYCIQALPEFDGKRFQNVAKEGVKFDESEKAKEKRETLEKEFEPLTTWLKDKALKDKVRRCHCCWPRWEPRGSICANAPLRFRLRRPSFLRG